jgi:hypothetical protein
MIVCSEELKGGSKERSKYTDCHEQQRVVSQNMRRRETTLAALKMVRRGLLDESFLTVEVCRLCNDSDKFDDEIF